VPTKTSLLIALALGCHPQTEDSLEGASEAGPVLSSPGSTPGHTDPGSQTNTDTHTTTDTSTTDSALGLSFPATVASQLCLDHATPPCDPGMWLLVNFELEAGGSGSLHVLDTAERGPIAWTFESGELRIDAFDQGTIAASRIDDACFEGMWALTADTMPWFACLATTEPTTTTSPPEAPVVEGEVACSCNNDFIASYCGELWFPEEGALSDDGCGSLDSGCLSFVGTYVDEPCPFSGLIGSCVLDEGSHLTVLNFYETGLVPFTAAEAKASCPPGFVFIP
jgi:hypothetical protein